MLSTVVRGTRRSWARAPNIQVASARANKQQVRLEELCFQSGGLQRRAVPEEARGMGKGGGVFSKKLLYYILCSDMFINYLLN